MRAALSRSERASLQAIAVIGGCFAAFGLATREPSTTSYLFTIAAVAAAVLAVRKQPIPPAVCQVLPLLVAAHLAGGLVHIGDDVLYNASFVLPAFEYDHFVHGSAIAVATVTACALLVSELGVDRASRQAVVLCVLAGLGIGALNEMIEFLSTVAHHGDHVGGYTNTGWDLVSNTVGALVGARLIRTEAVQCMPVASSC